MSLHPLKAPFPYFGGKRRAAELVWERLGEVDNYIEPFMGSAAVLLARPHPPRIETVNDLDCYVANFWRATSRDPEAVAVWADGPVNEADLHARHRWLVLSEEATTFRQRMRTDPEYFDARVAGWWCWGLCCWIGGGWCTERGANSEQMPRAPRATGNNRGGNSGGVHAEKGPELDAKARGSEPPQRRPILGGGNPGTAGKDVHQKGPTENVPNLSAGWKQGGCGVNGKGPKEQLPDLAGESGAAGRGVHASAGHKKRPNLGDRASGSGVLSGVPATWDQVPNLGGWNGDGQGSIGVHSAVPDHTRPQLGDARARGRGVHSNDDASSCRQRREWLIDWFGRLRDRLRTVRVCCGDWRRVCDSRSVTTRLGVTGILFDPPYSAEAGRDMNLYATESGTVAHDVRAYCLERGDDPLMRIALCGYAGEGHEALEARGWECVGWKASGGYGNRSSKGKSNAARERIWFSPHCRSPRRDPLSFGLLPLGD